MKFQYKINGVIEFQTDSIYEFIAFLNKSGDTKSVLAHLLDQKGSYTADFNTP